MGGGKKQESVNKQVRNNRIQGNKWENCMDGIGLRASQGVEWPNTSEDTK